MGKITEIVSENQIEQINMRMPQVSFIFQSESEQTAENLKAYVGEEALQFVSLETFGETEEGIDYYILLDVSASISKSEFKEITTSLEKFSKTIRQQDHLVCLTFGEDVEIICDMTGEQCQNGEAAEQLQQLSNTDQKTLLFEAISQMAQKADKVSEDEYQRQVALVITDGENIAKGKATRQEALEKLQKVGMPVYGFTSRDSRTEDVNAFGEFARTAGGDLTLLDEEMTGFAQLQERLLSSYKVVFEAESNKVNNDYVPVVLEFLNENEKHQYNVLQDSWIQDTIQPTIETVTCKNTKQVQVTFSEAVTGTEAVDNYRLINEEQEYIPSQASAGSDGKSVILSFQDEFISGEYRLTCTNISDVSMEKNSVEEGLQVHIEGIEKTEPAEIEIVEEEGVFQTYGWMCIVGGLTLVIIGLLLAWSYWKKRKAVVIVEDKAFLKENAQVHQHVVLEKKQLEEKQVYFRVNGQKQEFPVTIRKSIIVGRCSSCEVYFDDPTLSRQHFAIELENGKSSIRNLSKTSHTSVNGIRLGDQSYSLQSGDQIMAGQLTINIRW